MPKNDKDVNKLELFLKDWFYKKDKTILKATKVVLNFDLDGRLRKIEINKVSYKD